jgi:hypothetical protein
MPMTKPSINQIAARRQAQEIAFGRRFGQRLEQSLDNLPAATTDRLAGARLAAMARKKPDAPLPVFAPALAASGRGRRGGDGNRGIFSFEPRSWFGRLSMALPLVILVAGLFGIYEGEQERRIDDLADIDAMVLSDELPLSAYLDHGFNAYLAKHAEE